MAGCADLTKRAPPTYLSFPHGEASVARHATGFADLPGGFVPLSDSGVLAEQRALLDAPGGGPLLGGKRVTFRSDHASNYLPLKGSLPRGTT